jgi:hypothetical protein
MLAEGNSPKYLEDIIYSEDDGVVLNFADGGIEAVFGQAEALDMAGLAEKTSLKHFPTAGIQNEEDRLEANRSIFPGGAAYQKGTIRRERERISKVWVGASPAALPKKNPRLHMHRSHPEIRPVRGGHLFGMGERRTRNPTKIQDTIGKRQIINPIRS